MGSSIYDAAVTTTSNKLFVTLEGERSETELNIQGKQRKRESKEGKGRRWKAQQKKKKRESTQKRKLNGENRRI
jgi:hypothetical protein